jgi:hypothetical protein
VAKLGLSADDLAGNWDHHWLSHALANRTLPELALWGVGLVPFGCIVERHTGKLRAAAAVSAGAFAGAMGHGLFHTPQGQQAVVEWTDKTYWQIAESRGLADADKFAAAAGWVCRGCQRDGLELGSAGVVGALLAFAAFRRDLFGHGLTVRPLKFVLAAAYLAGWRGWCGRSWWARRSRGRCSAAAARSAGWRSSYRTCC